MKNCIGKALRGKVLPIIGRIRIFDQKNKIILIIVHLRHLDIEYANIANITYI